MRKSKEVVARAREMYANRDKYAYLYGGKGEIGNDALVDALYSAYPSHYAPFDKQQIKNFVRGKIVLDCSGFVCTVMGVGMEGSSQIIAHCKPQTTPLQTPGGGPQWKQGHIGIDLGDGTFMHMPNELRTLEIGNVKNSFWVKGGYYPDVDYSDEGEVTSYVANSLSGYSGKGIGTATSRCSMNIRTSASLSSPSVGVINAGVALEVLEYRADGWLKVVWAGCPNGYAYTSNISNAYYDYVSNAVTALTGSTSYSKGNKVIVSGTLYATGKGTGSCVQRNNVVMYVSDVVNSSIYPYYIGVSDKSGGERTGWVNPSSLTKL